MQSAPSLHPESRSFGTSKLICVKEWTSASRTPFEPLELEPGTSRWSRKKAALIGRAAGGAEPTQLRVADPLRAAGQGFALAQKGFKYEGEALVEGRRLCGGLRQLGGLPDPSLSLRKM